METNVFFVFFIHLKVREVRRHNYNLDLHVVRLAYSVGRTLLFNTSAICWAKRVFEDEAFALSIACIRKTYLWKRHFLQKSKRPENETKQ